MPSATERGDIDSLVIGGTASRLADLGFGTWDDFGTADVVYDTDTEYPIYGGPDLPSNPDRLILVSPVARSNVRSTYSVQTQVRLRGKPDEGPAVVARRAQDIADAFAPAGMPYVPVGGLLGPLRNVGAVGLFGQTLPLTPDTARRWGYVINLRIRFRWIR